MSTVQSADRPEVAERWKYGEEGQRYPVRVGEVWSVGEHVFACSDLMLTNVLDDCLPPAGRDVVVYCDPPWGQNLLNGFRTKAGLDRAEYDWTDIYRRVAGIAQALDAPLWIEGSTIDKKTGAPIPNLIGRPGDYTAYHQASYFGTNAYGLYYSGRVAPPAEVAITKELADFHVTEEVLRHYPSTSTVIDPCGGLGGIQLTAEKLGMASVSNELSPYRTSKAMARMADVTGKEARRAAR